MHSKYLHIALHAAIQAGEAILEIYQTSDFQVEMKSDNSPLTIADRESHRIISRHLSQASLPILSEEGREVPYGDRKHWDLFWIVDPLDGTKEFISRNGEFTINIALARGTSPVVGIIYSPVRQLLYFAMAETGSFRLRPPFPDFGQISPEELTAMAVRLPVAQSRTTFTAVGSRSHMNGRTLAFIDRLREEHGQVDLISSGSALKFCQVAEGLADVYPRFAPTYEWDTAAGQAIVEGAGGKVMVEGGIDPLGYNKPDLVNPGFVAYGNKWQ